jgi:two-component system sensor histidine kinase and response regulator WspE
VLRELHGLKGEARMMGFDDINSLVHEMEELVRASERTGRSLSSGSTDVLLLASDAVMLLAGVVSRSRSCPRWRSWRAG